MPRVSIIVPNYNHSRYLQQRIDSILNQTYQDFELLLLDDCSTDNSSDILFSYRSNPHVTQILINDHNSGSPFLQWKKGIELSVGQLIWIAESDDFCMPTMLERLVSMFDKYTDLSMAFCGMYFVDENSRIKDQSHFSTEGVEVMSGTCFIEKFELHGNNIRNASAVLFDRSKSLMVNQSYSNFKAAGDYFFWCQMMSKGDVAFVDEVLNFCRVDGKNVTSKSMSSGLSFIEDYKIHKYLRKMGYISSLYDDLSIRHYYLDWIRDSEFDTNSIKQNIINLWSTIGVIKPKYFHFWYRMVKKIHNVIHRSN